MDNNACDVRTATPDDADVVASLLRDFNTEFDTPSPSVSVIARRLRSLLASSSTFAILAGRPVVALALVTLRSNIWHDGQVALLDELYVVPDRRNQGIGSAVVEKLLSCAPERGIDLVEINVDEGDTDAQRFYKRHGFLKNQPDTDERAFYFFQETAA